MVSVDIGLMATALGLLGAIGGIAVWWANLRQRFHALERHDKADREVQALMLQALFAITDGLKQQGCNGEVTKAHQTLKDYVIKH